MAEGVLRNLDTFPSDGHRRGCLQVFSAGTEPASLINPYAVKAMQEIGIDISGQYPKNVEQFLRQPFDYVITVCDNAKETCPVFYGEVKHRLHYSIPDPADASGTDEEKLSVYRNSRDHLTKIFTDLYNQISNPKP